MYNNDYYIYKINNYESSENKKALEEFKNSDIFKKIISKYNLENCTLLSETTIGSNVNIYYQPNNDKSIIYLIIYRVDFVTKDIVHKVIILDANLFEKLIQYNWRYIRNGRVVYYKLDTRSQKKLSQINLLDIVTGEEKATYNFINKDKNDYRKINIKVAGHINIVDPSININTFKSGVMESKEIEKKQLITEKEFNKYLQTYKCLYKFTSHLNENYYLDHNQNTTYLIIKNLNNNLIYKVLIDKNITNIIKEYFWRVNELNESNRHPKHMRYVETSSGLNRISLHRFIIESEISEGDSFLDKKDLVVDHIDKNPLNNKRSNLRLVNYVINNRNQITRANNNSGVTGVRFNPQKNAWFAKRDIYPDGRFGKVKARALRTKTFEEAVKIRSYLEKIPDDEFLSNTPTIDLIEKYKNKIK